MNVILQERVANLGNVGDQVSVKPGYGRNFLLPFGKAVLATPGNIIEFEKRRGDLEKAAADNLIQAKKRAEELAKAAVKLIAQASEEGKLYGSIGPRDIAQAIVDSGVSINKSEVSMPEGPIRSVGEHDVTLVLHSEVSITITVMVEAIKTA